VISDLLKEDGVLTDGRLLDQISLLKDDRQLAFAIRLVSHRHGYDFDEWASERSSLRVCARPTRNLTGWSHELI